MIAAPTAVRKMNTQAHILQYTNGKARATRYNAMVELHFTITITTGRSTTWMVLHACLIQWAEGNASPTLDARIQLRSRNLQEAVHAAITEQTSIAWEFAFYGYLSSKWLFLQQLECPKSSIQGTRAQWTKPVILALLTFYQSMLRESRNDTLHGSTQISQDFKASSLEATVRRLYSLPDASAISDQILFTLPTASPNTAACHQIFPRHHLNTTDQLFHLDPLSLENPPNI